MIVAPIVEGHGEVAALPELLRRLNAWICPAKYIDVAAPIRTNKSRFLNDEEEFSKIVLLASYKATDDGWILILLDADDDCPVQLASAIRKRASRHVGESRLGIVIANREYEAWFIAAATSIDGHRGFRQFETVTADPDQPRDAKGWLSRQMDGAYHEVTDQPAFSAVMSLELAWQTSRSFRRLCAEYCRHSGNLS